MLCPPFFLIVIGEVNLGFRYVNVEMGTVSNAFAPERSFQERMRFGRPADEHFENDRW
jgi:hypothetical protein